METYQMKKHKDVEISAVQLTAENAKDVAEWCKGTLREEIDPFDSKVFFGINVNTLQGRRRASEGDYIVKVHDWQFAVFKTGEFLENWELAE